MIRIIKRNWQEIQRVMLLSQRTTYTWFEYSQKITNGLPSHAVTKKGCGCIIFFVERLNEYATLPDVYLRYAKNMTDEEISFISENRGFLRSIK